MRIGKLVLALGVVALLSAPALAQRQPGGRGQGGGRGGFGADLATLARNKSVQEELKIDKDEATKITDALKKVQDDNKDDVAKLADRNTAQEDRAAIRKKMNEANETALKGVLTSEQAKRLHQIQHQVQGIALFQDAEAQKTLKLTDEQKEKIKTINDDLQKDVTEARGGAGGGRGRGANPETLTKIQGLRKEAMTKVTKVLTDDQKKTYDDMTGKPFDYKPDAPAGGRGRGTNPDKPRTDF